MPQTLLFEAAWERTVSDQDRNLIQEKFHQSNHAHGQGISFTYLRHDYNHRKALLVIALIHNYQNEATRFTGRKITCLNEDGSKIAIGEFSVPIEIPAQTSMPWTFIFSDGEYDHKAIGNMQLKT